jgi:uncharacterized protein YjiS (DUF1127 family)
LQCDNRPYLEITNCLTRDSTALCNLPSVCPSQNGARRPKKEIIMSATTPELCSDLAAADRRPSLIVRVAQSIRAKFEAYAEERARCETVRVLRQLDDRTLKDIGLHRSEIGSLAYGTRGERGWTR